MRTALFPGTFDPMTLGHTDVIDRAKDLFDKIVVGIGKNAGKQPMFDLNQRMDWIKQIYKDEPRIEVHSYECLTIDYCRQIGARYILRGIRNVGDFEYEKSIADMNRQLNEEIETIFLACSSMYTSYSSTIVRDIIRNNGAYAKFLPKEIVIK